MRPVQRRMLPRRYWTNCRQRKLAQACWPMLAAVAWNMFADHPIQGVGFGQYKQRDNEYISKHNFDMPLHRVRPYVQHNVIFALLTEVGMLGTVPFLFLLGAWTRNALRLWTDHSVEFTMRAVSLVFLAYLVNYLINGMFHDVALIQMMNLGLFFLAGLMMSVCQSTRVTQAEELPTYETRPQSSSLTLT